MTPFKEPEQEELQRAQESELDAGMKRTGAAPDYAREMIFAMIRRTADNSLSYAFEHRRHHNKPISEAFQVRFAQDMRETADAILLAAQTALDWTSDPFAALHELREPERQAAQRARVAELVQSRTAELAAAIDASMAKKKAELIAAVEAQVAHFGGDIA